VAPKQWTIGRLARAGGVPVSTVRYYERAGLLHPHRRSASNYRLYSDEDLHRLRFIRAAQASGFTLDDVRELLRPAPCRDVQRRIERRLAEVATRARELRHLERVLRASLDLCRAHEATGRCEVVRSLSAAARAGRPQGTSPASP
jgi:MerR family mercuric resistance operon transcriptional regulator